jgi:hypothetical protein
MLELATGTSASCTESARRGLSLRPRIYKLARNGMLKGTIPAGTAGTVAAIDIVMRRRRWGGRGYWRTWLVLGYGKLESDGDRNTVTYREQGLRLRD